MVVVNGLNELSTKLALSIWPKKLALASGVPDETLLIYSEEVFLEVFVKFSIKVEFSNCSIQLFFNPYALRFPLIAV